MAVFPTFLLQALGGARYRLARSQAMRHHVGMAFVYHRRHPDFRGTILYPLNQLRVQHPDLYARQARKYDGREALRNKYIPPLKLAWTDVLHCAPIHPHLVYQAVQATGLEYEDRLFFAIPVERLRGLPVAILLPDAESRYEPFDERRYHELMEVPKRTLEYFADEVRSGRRPLLHEWMPHVLIGAPLSTEGLQELSWRQAPQ